VSTPRRKTLSETDRGEWAAYARHVAPLPGRALPEAPPPAEAPAPQPESRAPIAPRSHRAPPSPVAIGANPAGLDNASWNRLRSGKLQPTRTLDLHGRTAQRAFHALHAFLQAAHADRVRCVEVITGRGAGESGGVIRRELPVWLNLPTLRPLVLAATHPHPANPGSVRLLLRRTR
jgi:DNA-nicking Smr family endonuclease